MNKRLISMILALSMLFSLCPVSAFAEADFTGTDTAALLTGDIVLFAAQPTAPLTFKDGRPYVTDNNGTMCPGVSASVNPTKGIYTYAGDGWAYQIPCEVDADGNITLKDPPYSLYITENTDLKGQEIADDVDVVVSNKSTLRNATVNGDLTIEPGSSVKNVTCNGTTTNNGTIESGHFKDVTNNGILQDGTFDGTVDNNGTISGGTFNGDVTNDGTINGGTFQGDVTNNENGTITDGDFTGADNVMNKGNITGGSFKDATNNGTIAGGTFSGEVDNNKDGTISDGTFSGKVDNEGNISGGSFTGSSNVTNNGTISGGDFSGKVDNDKNGTISNGDFTGANNVTNKGDITGGSFKDATNDGTIAGGDFSGKVDNNKDGTISDGTFSDKVDNNGSISGGHFTGSSDVTNDGTISGGDFSGKVDNDKNGTISNGDFTGADNVTNKGDITGGSFKDATNDGTIAGGDFSGKVDNNKDGIISDGSFDGTVDNNGTINGGNFSDKGEVNNKQDGSINGGNFSGKVDNDGSISGGTFKDDVTGSGTVSGGAYSKRPAYDSTVSDLSTVHFLDNALFSVNDTLKDLRELYVLTPKGGSQKVTFTAGPAVKNFYNYKEQTRAESWQEVSADTIEVDGGTYILNLNEYTANDFAYDPAQHKVSWEGSNSGKPQYETVFEGPYGTIYPSYDALDKNGAPGDYKVKINVAGSSTYMQATGLTDSSWTFSIDPRLEFVNATATVDGKPVSSGDRIPEGVSVTLTADSDDFKEWSVIGGTLPDADLTKSPLTFQMPNANLDITALDTPVTPSTGSNDSGSAALTVLGAAAGGFAVYYLGFTAFLRTILPQECAIPTNRESLANALWVMCGRPETSNTTVFVDVPETSSALPAIRWAVEKGVMTGTVQSDGLHFAPSRYTTRLEVFLTWYRMFLNDTKNNG